MYFRGFFVAFGIHFMKDSIFDAEKTADYGVGSADKTQKIPENLEISENENDEEQSEEISFEDLGLDQRILEAIEKKRF